MGYHFASPCQFILSDRRYYLVYIKHIEINSVYLTGLKSVHGGYDGGQLRTLFAGFLFRKA
jgi:hypothetical protein